MLEHTSEALIRLNELEQKKREIVLNDDLAALNEIINSEQAEALHFRGLEQKGSELLKKLNIRAAGLQAIPEYFPQELRSKAEQAVADVQTRYKEYQISAGSARKALEKGLAEIDNILAAMGEPISAGPGYTADNVPIPANMKTDFRA